MKFLNQVKKTIKHHNLLDFGDRVLIGVSGGADSLALLFTLNYLKKELGLYLHVAHLDHMMRKDSYRDKLFVENLAGKLNIPATGGSVNISKIAKKGSLEEIARISRFNFLFKVAKQNRCKKIALGHTKDDQAETVLMRILRGAGLYGLQAILPKRKIKNHIVIRPLIEIERKAIEQFLKNKKIIPRVDKTNLSLRFFRNRIRHKLIPLLMKEYNSNIKQILNTTALNVGSDYAYIEKLSKNALRKCSLKNKCSSRKIELSIERFQRLDFAIQRMVLRLAINKLKNNLRRLTFKHLQEVESLIKERPANSIVDLPCDISIKKKKISLLIYKK